MHYHSSQSAMVHALNGAMASRKVFDLFHFHRGIVTACPGGAPGACPLYMECRGGQPPRAAAGRRYAGRSKKCRRFEPVNMPAKNILNTLPSPKPSGADRSFPRVTVCCDAWFVAPIHCAIGIFISLHIFSGREGGSSGCLYLRQLLVYHCAQRVSSLPSFRSFCATRHIASPRRPSRPAPPRPAQPRENGQ